MKQVWWFAWLDQQLIDNVRGLSPRLKEAICIATTLGIIVFVVRSANAETILSTVAFTNRFTELPKVGYVEVTKADLDGIIWRKITNRMIGGRLSYTNVPPEKLIELGIPTNRIAIAADRAADQAERRNKRYADQLNEAPSILQAQRYGDILAATAAQEQAAAQANAQAATLRKQRIAALKAQIAADRRASRQLWDRWVFTDSDYAASSSSTHGRSSVDNDATRLHRAREMDNRIAEETEQLNELQNEENEANRAKE